MPDGNTTARGDIVFQVDVSRLSRWTLWLCLLSELTFFVLDYHVNYGRGSAIGALRRMFNTAREDGLASWFATTQTLLAGLTLWCIFAVARASRLPRGTMAGWAVLASFFTYMAVDDGAQIHERLGSALQASVESAKGSLDFFPSYTWQLVFVPVFGALGAFTFVFLWTQLRDARSRLILFGALSLMALAVGLDFIEGLDDDHPWNLYTTLIEHFDIDPWARARFGHSDFDTLVHFAKSLEETIEMAANSLFWFLFLGHLPRVSREFRVRLEDASP